MEYVKLEIFTPREHAMSIIAALTEIGACRIGKYDHVASLTEVTGTWRPLTGSHPAIGTEGQIEQAPEIKIECPCPTYLVKRAVEVVREHHPYEEPCVYAVSLSIPPEKPNDDLKTGGFHG